MGSKKKNKDKVEKEAKPVVTFTDVLNSFATTAASIVAGLKSRQGGAHAYGADGLFVCAVESLHNARGSKNLEDYLKAAGYSIAAAMKAANVWEYPLEQTKAEEKKEEEKEGDKENVS